ncbi:MauE/DoxX family redox-associated membrane protein [Catenulispora subtropica]|uniref:MauE/DoxX family redox-associated membrane protein n=1 Tax=Catenulispora subtropica TaxID=450798 RepID=UPI0031E123D5
MRYVDVAGRLLLCTVFVFSTAGKVWGRTAWDEFVDSLRRMAVVGDDRVDLAARSAVAAEAAIVVLALIPSRIAAVAAYVLATGLLTVFTAAIAAVLRRRGAATSCRCFGASTTPLAPRHVARNITLIAACLAGLLGSQANGPLHLSLALVAGVFGATLGLLVTRLDDVAELLRVA